MEVMEEVVRMMTKHRSGVRGRGAGWRYQFGSSQDSFWVMGGKLKDTAQEQGVVGARTVTFHVTSITVNDLP